MLTAAFERKLFGDVSNLKLTVTFFKYIQVHTWRYEEEEEEIVQITMASWNFSPQERVKLKVKHNRK